MAKQTKNAASAANGTETAKPNEAATAKVGGARGEKDRFVRVYDAGKPKPVTGKIAPQAQVILNGIEAAGKDGILRPDLVKALTGVLQTKQPVGRIVSYYQKDLESAGLVTITKG